MPIAEDDQTIWEQLEEIYHRHVNLPYGVDVRYHPPDMIEDRDQFGLAIAGVEGEIFAAGDHEYRFPLQSISKVITYGMVLEAYGREETLKHVGVEPSGDPFNSFNIDERNNRPFNPMVNAGALVVVNMLPGKTTDEKVEEILERARLYTGNPELEVDEELLESELTKYNDRNLGLSYLLRSMGLISGNVEENIKVYLSACSIRVDVKELAIMGVTLANGGVNPRTQDVALPRQYARDLITVMTTCGMYDVAGEWAYDVGIPAKSSVSGAIMLSMPHYFGAGLISPALDESGASVRGVAVCRELSARFGLHMFADPLEDRLGRWV